MAQKVQHPKFHVHKYVGGRFYSYVFTKKYGPDQDYPLLYIDRDGPYKFNIDFTGRTLDYFNVTYEQAREAQYSTNPQPTAMDAFEMFVIHLRFPSS